MGVLFYFLVRLLRLFFLKKKNVLPRKMLQQISPPSQGWNNSRLPTCILLENMYCVFFPSIIVFFFLPQSRKFTEKVEKVEKKFGQERPLTEPRELAMNGNYVTSESLGQKKLGESQRGEGVPI